MVSCPRLALLLSSLAFAFLAPLPAWAATPEQIRAEISGIELSHARQTSLNVRSGPRALTTLPTGGVLLVPDSTNHRVMAFSPTNGNLVDANFIPASPSLLNIPICAIPSPDGRSVYVSDQLLDIVQEFDFRGNYIGVFAPAGGVNTSILDNIRGISLDSAGNLLVTVGEGANANSIPRFDGNGNYLGNFIAAGAGGLNEPFDVLPRASDYLVGGIDSHALHRYDLNGNFLANLTSVNDFPEQLALASNGNVLVANYSGTEEGILEYTSAGAFVGRYNPTGLGAYRGVYELPNNNLLVTNGDGVYEIDRSGNLVETKISGVSARFIEYYPGFVDLSLAISAPSSVPAGQPFQVQLTVTNNGNSIATGIQVAMLIPPGLTFQSSSCGAAVAGGTLTWDIASLGTETPAQCEITMFAGSGIANLTATVASDQTDTAPGDNSDSAPIILESSTPVPAMNGLGGLAMAGLLLAALLVLRTRLGRAS